MATSAKASKMSAELADRLKIRPGLSALTVRESVDTDGNPLILVGAGSAGGENAVVKTKPVVWSLATDVLGLAANIYTPHVMQVVTEANPTGGSGADPLSAADLLSLIAQCSAMGCIVEWYQSAAGVAPTAAAIITANLKATYYPDARYPLISGQ